MRSALRNVLNEEKKKLLKSLFLGDINYTSKESFKAFGNYIKGRVTLKYD